MNIIIVGCGRIGSTLVEELSGENHDISIIDEKTVSGFTTTGYASTDFNKWPEFSKFILVMLMFSGACAGSTGGGMKVSRLVIMLKFPMLLLINPYTWKEMKLKKNKKKGRS
ncbi:potassium transporter [Anaerostipes hadrus]|jgi:Trk-type K+ transport system membrane component|nr:potassium transporter [Anaerostipes hadrus]